MSISNDNYDRQELNDICKAILQQQGIRCYFCEVIGKRWSFMAGDENIIAAPHRYMLDSKLGIIADKKIMNLDKYTENL